MRTQKLREAILPNNYGTLTGQHGTLKDDPKNIKYKRDRGRDRQKEEFERNLLCCTLSVV